MYYSSYYNQGKWDGYNEFFKLQSGRFLTGLLPEICLVLKRLNFEYEIEDVRPAINFSCESVDANLLNYGNDPIVLRDYQVTYINYMIKHKRGIVPSPTSSGKTNVVVGLLKVLPKNTPTLILANRKSLVEQNYDEIKKWGIENVGLFYGKYKTPNIITCATSQSAMGLEPILPKIKCLIVEEVHEMMSKVTKKIYSKLTGALVRMGLSATPFKFARSDKNQMYDVKGWIGPEFNTKDGKIDTKTLQDRNILSSSQCYFFKVKQPALLYEIYMDAVTKGIAENEHFHDMTVKLVDKLSGRILIIVERIEHGDRLQNKMPNALWVRGKDTSETRKIIIDRLKTEKDKIVAIATSGIFNTGINVFVHNLINAAGGQAEHQIIQRFGRGLRVAKDKQHLCYFDFMFEINEYLEKHSRKRMRVLKKEGHPISLLETVDEFTLEEH